MQQDSHNTHGGKIVGLVAASLAAHALVAGLFFLRLPQAAPEAPPESISVELVPPPEPEKVPEPEVKPEAPNPEEKALVVPKVEELKPEEKPPEAEAGQPKPEEKPAEPEKAEEPPPETKPPEPAKEQEPPPQAKPPEPAKAEEPPPPPAPTPEPPPPAEPPKADAPQTAALPLPVLPEVHEFGDKDAGPRTSQDGDSAVDGTDPNAADPPGAPEAEPPAIDPADPQAAEKPPGEEAPSASPRLPEIALPEGGATDSFGEKDGPVALGPETAKALADAAEPLEDQPPLPTPPLVPPKPLAKPPQSQVKLTEAKKLFSNTDTSDPRATTAVGDVPANRRIEILCGTELLAQLRHATPAYRPDIVPAYRHAGGNILAAKGGAFRSGGNWYDVSFRCEVDPGALKVVSFAFDVGAAVPKGDWKRRGFPNF
jgi:hypothetical protein